MALAEKNETTRRAQGLTEYTKMKNEQTIREVNRVIDDLYARNEKINFEIVAKLSGVSRGTLYNNEELRDRIQRLRAGGTDELCDVLKEKNRRQEEKLRKMRKEIRQLQEDKKKLIVQLIDYEDLRRENERLRRMKGF